MDQVTGSRMTELHQTGHTLAEEKEKGHGKLFDIVWPVVNNWLDVLFALILFVGQINVQYSPSNPGLDPSWFRALQECHKNHAQAGKDYVFTYGPLGFLASERYDRDTYWLKYGWELLFSLFATFVFVSLARLLPQKDIKLIYYSILLLFLYQMNDLRFEFTALAALIILFVSKPPIAQSTYLGVFLGIICLFKFTFVAMVLPAVMMVTAWKWWETRRRIVFILPAACGAGFASIWLATGQSLLYLPRFFIMSMEVARGYVEAMSMAGSRPILNRALVIIALDVLTCLAIFVGSPNKKRFLVCLILALSSLYLQFRHGFVRQDMVHPRFFFVFTMVFPFVIVAVEPVCFSRWIVRAGFGMSIILSIHAFSAIEESHKDLFSQIADVRLKLRERAFWLLRPRVHQSDMERMEQVVKDHCQLPKIKALVGNRSIDMISYRQGLLFLNDLKWTPRPIFQSYSAYTPKLLAANQEFYQSPNAPEFVLFRLETIDGRFPALDDGGVLLELLRSYRPVLHEKGNLLLQHQPSASFKSTPCPSRTTTLAFHFGEEIPIPFKPGEYLTGSFQFRLKESGRLLHALFRDSHLTLHVRLVDGSARQFRLVPGQAGQEFLLNPLVENTDDFVMLYGGLATKQIAALSITQEKVFRLNTYHSDVQMTLRAYPLSLIQKYPGSEIYPFTGLAAALGDPPASVENGYPRVVNISGQDCLHVDNGTVTYKIHPGQKTCSGQYGLSPDVYGLGKTDGVEFTVVYVSSTGSRQVLFRDRLAPNERLADQGIHRFSVRLPAHHTGGTLQLKTGDSPPHSPYWDWSYWSQIHIH